MTVSEFSHYLDGINYKQICFAGINQPPIFSGVCSPLQFGLIFTDVQICLHPNTIYLFDSHGNMLYFSMIIGVTVEEHILGTVARITCKDQNSYYSNRTGDTGIAVFTVIFQ